MAGQERFSYHHAEEINDLYKKRPVVIGAPYVLCIFIVGVILMGVGTFITSHALENYPNDRIFRIVGPVLLGVGGILLLGTVVLCSVACCKNSQLQQTISEEFLSIGGSTFYGGRGFSYLVNDDELQRNSPQQFPTVNNGFENTAGPPSHYNPQDEGVIFLANTVAEERNRQRKYSRKQVTNLVSDNPVESCRCNGASCSHHYITDHQNAIIQQQMNQGSRTHLDHLGLEKLRRADPYPELARDFDLGEGDSYSTRSIRDRSASVCTRHQHGPSVGPVPHRLRRNVTYSAATRGRQAASRRQQQYRYNDQQTPLQKSSAMWRQRSLQRKPREKKEATSPENVQIHELPEFDPNLLNALGITPLGKKSPEPDDSNDLAVVPPRSPRSPRIPRSPSTRTQHHVGQLSPESGHGSLGNPRRRPSMVMGVSSLHYQQPSGSAYRHRSSIYASDMTLHRNKDSSTTLSEESGTPHDVNNKHQQEACALPGGGRDRRRRGRRRGHTSSSFKTGSNPEIEFLHQGPKKSWFPSSSSSSQCQEEKEGRQNSIPPESQESSRCGSDCNSRCSSHLYCSGCDSDCDGKTNKVDRYRDGVCGDTD